MTPEETTGYFTTPDGAFRFSRWERPLAPVVFGTDDATLDAIKDAIKEVASLCDLHLSDVDPEFGANFLVFFCKDWDELSAVPDLDRLIPDLPALITRLNAQDANQYRLLRHDDDGSINLCLNLNRMNSEMADISARDITLNFTFRSMLLWGSEAFESNTPLGRLKDGGIAIIKPEFAALLRAAYDKRIPAASEDPALAYRLSARATLLLADLGDNDEP